MADSRRLFFALWPDEAVRGAIAQAAQRQFGAADPAAARRYHLTLLFLGDVEAALQPAVEQAGTAVRAEPFELGLDRCGAFGRALWLGPTNVPQALIDLGTGLRRAARAGGLPHDERPLTPHVTCLREARPPPTGARFEPVRWPVQDFVLVHSLLGRTAEYRVLRRWPLVKSGHMDRQRE